MFTKNHSKYYPVGSRGADFSQSSLFGSQLPITHRAPIDRAFFVNRDLTKLRRQLQRERKKKKNRFNEQNSNSARASLFCTFLCSPCINNDVKWPSFKFTWERRRQGDEFYHLCHYRKCQPPCNSAADMKVDTTMHKYSEQLRKNVISSFVKSKVFNNSQPYIEIVRTR